jgi:hypothetical protein
LHAGYQVGNEAISGCGNTAQLIIYQFVIETFPMPDAASPVSMQPGFSYLIG